MDIDTIGKFMRAERKKQHIKLYEMEKIVGYERTHLSRVENCRVRPSLELVTNYLNALGYDVNIEVLRRE